MRESKRIICLLCFIKLNMKLNKKFKTNNRPTTPYLLSNKIYSLSTTEVCMSLAGPHPNSGDLINSAIASLHCIYLVNIELFVPSLNEEKPIVK